MLSVKELGKADSVSVSEIENLFDSKETKKLSNEEHLIDFINKFRFKNRNIMNKLIDLISNKANKDDCSIKMETLNKTISYQNETYLNKMQNYLQQIDIVNYILPDFTFSQPLQDHFITKYSKILDTNNNLFTNQSQDFIQNFKESFQAPYYYGYSISKIPLTDLDNLLIMIMVEEFILLNKNIYKNENIQIEFDKSIFPEQLGLLSNIFNVGCVYIKEVKPVSQQQQSKESKQLYNVYILLMYTEAFERNDIPTRMRKTVDGKSVIFQKTHSISNQTSKNKKNQRDSNPKVPEKYNKVFHRTTQIPRKSVQILVEAMDTDGDNKITAQDIKKFSYKYFINLEDEIYENMFKEAASKRIVTHSSQYEKPISIEEILAAVTLHLHINENRIWVEYERPYRKQWVQFLECVGEKVPYSHDLPKINYGGIRDLSQIQIETFKPQINKQKCLSEIKPLPPKQYTPLYRPEAGIIINNTENIRELVVQNDNDQKQKKEQEPFEQVVNSKFRSVRNDQQPLIMFETQKYYKEALRLSKNPQQYLKTQKNPIYSYIPENFNFQINNKQENNQQNQLLDTQQQLKRYQSIKGSKAFSSNIFVNNDYESFSQMPVLDDQYLDESDLAVSLLKTQSLIPANTMKLGKTFFSNQNQPLGSQLNINNIGNQSIPILQRIKLRERQMLMKSQSLQTQIKDPLQRDTQGLFSTTFKHEDVGVLKAKLAKQEPVTDPYNPVSKFNFREIPYVYDKRPPFNNRFQVDELENPQGMSVHDPRPREALEIEQKEQLKIQNQENNQQNQGQTWLKYFPKQDMQHNFADGQKPAFFPRGQYESPSNIIHNLLRGEATFNENFKLFHRPLRPQDKFLLLGQNPDSRF